MDKEGTIINMNHAFHLRFGYVPADLVGKNFSLLFTEKDQAINKPEREIQQVIETRCANDENYLVDKEGNKIWVTGESVLVENDAETYIIKVVHNIHAQKQLERFLLQSHEFIDTVFDSIDESALLLLDSRLRIIKANKTFIEMFELNQPTSTGGRLTDIDHSFWKRADVKQEIVNFLVMQNINEVKFFEMETSSGATKKISLQGKLIEGVPGSERKILVMIKYLPE